MSCTTWILFVVIEFLFLYYLMSICISNSFVMRTCLFYSIVARVLVSPCLRGCIVLAVFRSRFDWIKYCYCFGQFMSLVII